MRNKNGGPHECGVIPGHEMGLKQMASKDLILSWMKSGDFSASPPHSVLLPAGNGTLSKTTRWFTCAMSQQNQNKSSVWYGWQCQPGDNNDMKWKGLVKNKAETEKILSLIIFSLNSSHHESRQDRVPFGIFFLSGFHKVNPCVMLRKCTVLPELPTRAGLWRVRGGADLFLYGHMSHSLYQILIPVWFCELVALGVLGLWVWAGSEQPDPIWNHRHFWLTSTCL